MEHISDIIQRWLAEHSPSKPVAPPPSKRWDADRLVKGGNPDVDKMAG